MDAATILLVAGVGAGLAFMAEVSLIDAKTAKSDSLWGCGSCIVALIALLLGAFLWLVNHVRFV